MLGSLKHRARRYIPAPVRRAWADRADRRRPGSDSLAGVFSTIYENDEWGAGDGYYSGPGTDEHNSRDFVTAAKSLIAREGIRSVVDLGCGDFRVGGRIAGPDIDYVGVDIFEPLIAQNQQRHGRPGVAFRHLDASTEELPGADLVLIREVLQHLPNAAIAAILAQLPKFKFALIAEVQPAPGSVWKWNVDKAAAGRTRIFFDSAVKLDAAPFNLTNVERVASTVRPEWGVRSGETIDVFLVRTAA